MMQKIFNQLHKYFSTASKKTSLNLLLFVLFLFAFNLQSHSGELVVVLMVKNESANIVQTLQPYLDAGVQRYVVLDTGSDDDTVQIVQQLFCDCGIECGYVVQQPFVNFAVSRNYAIQCAEDIFVDDCFLFMPDAEWYMQQVPGLVQFCYEHHDDPANSFLVLLQNEDKSFGFYTQRLFKAHKGIRFEGAVHEAINQSSSVAVPEESYILWKPSTAGAEKSKQRWSRDLGLLLHDIQEHPENSRTAFYLAQTYECLGDLSNAAIWYEKRCQMCGWDEENFMSYYRLAGVHAGMQNWDAALQNYLLAFNLRPHRAEPIVRVAQHYWNTGQHALSFLFAFAACQIPYPQGDILFIERDVYDYIRYDVLGCAAWYLGKYEIGKDAVEMALKIHPNYPHLLRNLELYKNQLHL